MSEAKTLLEYVPDRLEGMERTKGEEDAARAEVRRIDGKILEAELALERRRAELVKPDRSRVLAAAMLAGEPPPSEPEEPPGPAVTDLEATVRGLREMRKPPQERIGLARAELRAQTIRAFREAAERAAPDLVEAAQRVENLHAQIGAAQRLVESSGAGQGPGAIVVGGDWWDLRIPSSEQIGALRRATAMKYSRPILVGGDRDGLNVAATAAFEKARAEVRRLVGRWPLDKEF
jgi:hypothetical protein